MDDNIDVGLVHHQEKLSRLGIISTIVGKDSNNTKAKHYKDRNIDGLLLERYQEVSGSFNGFSVRQCSTIQWSYIEGLFYHAAFALFEGQKKLSSYHPTDFLWK